MLNLLYFLLNNPYLLYYGIIYKINTRSDVMKFYQSKIFKIIMDLIAIIIIFKYSFLIFLAGIGLVAYLNKKNIKFRSFHKAGKIILSSFIILFTLFAIGIKNAPATNQSVATSSKVEPSIESAKSVEQSEVKE